MGMSECGCARAQHMLVGILLRLGFYISFKKLLPPAQVTRFLGRDIDSVRMELRLATDKLIKLTNSITLYVGVRRVRGN